MKKICRVLSGAIMVTTFASMAQAQQPVARHWAIALHGGAGIIERRTMDPGTEAAYKASLTQAIQAGSVILARGGSSLDAVEAAIQDSRRRSALQRGPRSGFHRRGQKRAGRGHHGRLESEGRGGGRRHPHSASHQPGARGDGEVAARNAHRRGRRRLCRAGWPGAGRPQLLFHRAPLAIAGQAVAEAGPPHSAASGRRAASAAPVPVAQFEVPRSARTFGTVGVVALDRAGQHRRRHLDRRNAGKRWGRVGDSPIIGAGTYASNQSCAVSATGAGEYFIRLTVAREVCAWSSTKACACSKPPTR